MINCASLKSSFLKVVSPQSAVAQSRENIKAKVIEVIKNNLQYREGYRDIPDEKNDEDPLHMDPLEAIEVEIALSETFGIDVIDVIDSSTSTSDLIKLVKRIVFKPLVLVTPQ